MQVVGGREAVVVNGEFETSDGYSRRRLTKRTAEEGTQNRERPTDDTQNVRKQNRRTTLTRVLTFT